MRKQALKRLGNLLKIVQLVSATARMQTSAFLTLKHVFLTSMCVMLIKTTEDTEL